jgi:AcrR family transcriptional regulator
MSTRGQRTRERLLALAEQQLVASGGALDIDTLAVAAGISVGGLYHHFGSKEALLSAVVEAFHERLAAQVVYADLGEPAQWPARERLRIRRAVRFYYDEPLATLLLARTAGDATVARVDAERLDRAAAVSAANLAAAQRAGVLASDLDCDAAGAMLMGGVTLVLARALRSDPRPDADALTATLWALVAGVVGISPDSA